jgi:hypothetical protein
MRCRYLPPGVTPPPATQRAAAYIMASVGSSKLMIVSAPCPQIKPDFHF